MTLLIVKGLLLGTSLYLVSVPISIGNYISRTIQRRLTMAWRSSGASNEALIENLFKNSLITSSRVKQAMLGVRWPDRQPSHEQTA